MRNAGKNKKEREQTNGLVAKFETNMNLNKKDDYKYLGSLEGDEKRSQKKKNQYQKNRKNE